MGNFLSKAATDIGHSISHTWDRGVDWGSRVSEKFGNFASNTGNDFISHPGHAAALVAAAYGISEAGYGAGGSGWGAAEGTASGTSELTEDELRRRAMLEGTTYEAKYAGMDAAEASRMEMMNASAGAPGSIGGPAAAGGGMGGLAGKMMLGGSLYGLYQGQQMMKLAQQQDPFSSQRAGYAAQLADLSANPDQLKKRPGYEYGMEAGLKGTQRALASGGYAGSGNEVIGMQDFSSRYAGTYLTAEQNRLAGLAGANIQPNMAGYSAALGTTNASLNNLVLWAMTQGKGQGATA